MSIAKIAVIIVIICAVRPLNSKAADGAIWFGNRDGSPLIFRIDHQEKVPVWIQTDSTAYVAAVHIPLASDNRYIAARTGGRLFEPFINDNPPPGFGKGWDSVEIRKPIENENNRTSQGILGFCDLAGTPNVPLQCLQPCQVAEFEMVTAAADSLRGHTYDVFSEGSERPSGGFHFSDTLGVKTFRFEAHYSQVYFLFPGDINDDFKVDKSDVKALKAYIEQKKAYPWPLERGDVNGDGVIDGEDLKALAELLKK